MAKIRYFVAYKLEGEEAQLVENLRREIADRFEVQAALLIPPHLTLFYPFEMEDSQEGDLVKLLSEFAPTQKAFQLSAKEFSHFEDRVWFIDVEQAQSLIGLKENLVRQIYKKIGILEERRGHNGIHFHITLAYKDVTPEKFIEIGDFLAKQNMPISRLPLDKITLFRFEQSRWKEVQGFPLGH